MMNLAKIIPLVLAIEHFWFKIVPPVLEIGQTWSKLCPLSLGWEYDIYSQNCAHWIGNRTFLG